MRINIALPLLLLILIITSCDNDEKEPNPQVIEKSNTIVVEKEVPVAKPVTPPPTPKPAENTKKDGTSVSVGSDGVEFSTKDGNKNTEIDLKKGGGSIKIER